MYEEAVRIPWLMRIPEMSRTTHLINNRVSHIDMVPTVLELMGSKADENFPGKSLVGLIKGDKVAEDHVFIEWNPSRGAAAKAANAKKGGTKLEELTRIENERTRVVISPDGWKLCLSDADKCQLFNLKKDPGETTNLFDSGLHKDVIGRLTKKIHRWQETVDDKVRV